MRYCCLILLLVFAGCSKDLLDTVPIDRGVLPLSPYVAIGGSETAGFADGALHLNAQLYSYPALIAQQLQQVGGSSFNQPLTIDSGGFVLIDGVLANRLKLGYSTDCSGIELLSPMRGEVTASTLASYSSTSKAGPFDNWGIPFLKGEQLVLQNLSASNDFYDRMGADTITLVEAINNRNPKLFTIWLGMEDILDNAINQAPEVAPIQFYNYLLPLLDSLTQDNSVAGFIATLPDVTAFPFFNTIPYNALVLDQTMADALNQTYAGTGMSFQTGYNAMVIEDPAAPAGKRQLRPTEKLMLSLPLDSLKCGNWGAQVPISARYVLDTQELEFLRYQVDNYNLFIRDLATEKGLNLVDIYALYQRLDAGITISGQVFSNKMVYGGFFSLDGINPSFRGAAIIANEFITIMNKNYRASIPLVSVVQQPGITFP
jgi:hypothetical protein